MCCTLVAWFMWCWYYSSQFILHYLCVCIYLYIYFSICIYNEGVFGLTLNIQLLHQYFNHDESTKVGHANDRFLCLINENDAVSVILALVWITYSMTRYILDFTMASCCSRVLKFIRNFLHGKWTAQGNILPSILFNQYQYLESVFGTSHTVIFV